MTQPIITRKEAKAQGLSFYFDGKPCKYGHVSLKRYPSSTCVDCDFKNKGRKPNLKRLAMMSVPEGFIGQIAALPNDRFYLKQFEAVEKIPFENLWLNAHNRILY